MAAITDPRAVAFANQKVRPLNDLMASTYLTAKNFIQAWNTQTMGTLLPFTQDIVADGASKDGIGATGGDGRPLLTAAAAEQVFNLASAIVNVFERGTVDTSGVANNANWNNVASIRVNGTPLF